MTKDKTINQNPLCNLLAATVESQVLQSMNVGHTTKDGKLPAELVKSTKTLWKGFAANREADEKPNLPNNYMADPQLRKAYLAGFFLPNTHRVWGALTRFAAKPLTAHLKHDSEIRILDFGCGPLSATAGLLLHLSETHDESLLQTLQIKVTAIDKSLGIVRDGIAILQESLGMRAFPNIEFQLHTELPHKSNQTDDTQRFHFILAANVLNELREAEKSKMIPNLASFLEPQGLLLVIEPARDALSWQLATMRDKFVASAQAKEQFALVGPCLHSKPCPLGPTSGRKDWCWFRHNWKAPRMLKALDEKTGLDHKELAYAFLLFQRLGFTKNLKTNTKLNLGRVVSDKIKLPKDTQHPQLEKLQKHILEHGLSPDDETLRQKLVPKVLAKAETRKLLLCTTTGHLQGLYTAKKEELKSRGSTLELTQQQVRSRERSKTVSKTKRNQY